MQVSGILEFQKCMNFVYSSFQKYVRIFKGLARGWSFKFKKKRRDGYLIAVARMRFEIVYNFLFTLAKWCEMFKLV